MFSYILAVLCGALFLGVDQFTKHYIMSNFELGQSKEFINGFIDIVYIHNRGGAWGMLSGYTWILLSISAVVMLVCIALLFKLGLDNKLMFWAITLVIFGGTGNMIDRIFRNGNVIDFLHFEFFPTFPVFNIADCAIVIGCGLLILYFIIDTFRSSNHKEIGNINE